MHPKAPFLTLVWVIVFGSGTFDCGVDKPSVDRLNPGVGGGIGEMTGGGGTGGRATAIGGVGTGGGATATGGIGTESGTGGSAGDASPCGAGDTNLPAEPTIPPACATLQANLVVAAGTPPGETNLDTSRIQTALNACASGQAVKLTTNGVNNAFITGPIIIPSGVTLWVDAGTTLYGTRDPLVYSAASALIGVRGMNSGIVGDGVIDGQGGEPKIGGTQSWWDVNGGGGSSPALIQVVSAINFVLYRITLHNSPMFHVKLAAKGFVVWGVTIKTPSTTTNSVGVRLSPSVAHNTDGLDPGQAASNGFIVCNKISVGDDQIALKGGTGVDHLTIAHNHFGAGHGMSIGSETNGGVSNINVYDLSIDGLNSGLGGGSSNGLRIKSDPSRGGLVSNVTYSDVCVRNLVNPILLTPHYTAVTGALIPEYTGITIQNFRSIASAVVPKVTLLGYDMSHVLGVTLDNVVVDGIAAANVLATNANVALGPGAVNLITSGTNVNVTNDVNGSSQPNSCTGKWVTF